MGGVTQETIDAMYQTLDLQYKELNRIKIAVDKAMKTNALMQRHIYTHTTMSIEANIAVTSSDLPWDLK